MILIIGCQKALTEEQLPILSDFGSEDKDYSKEIAQGKDIYIAKSQAGRTQLVDLLPVKATMSLEEMKDGRCELNILYEFDEDGGFKHHSFGFVISDVSVSVDGTKYSLIGNSLQGRWASKGIERGFDNVSVSGYIGFDGKSEVSLFGVAGGQDFTLKILESSGEYPGSQYDGVAAIIDYFEYREVSIANTSSSVCEISFQLSEMSLPINAQKKLKLESGENGVFGFLLEQELWGTECTQMDITFEGGKTVSVPAKDISGMKNGSSVGVLKRVGIETTWYIRAVGETSLIEPADFRTEVYEISAPE